MSSLLYRLGYALKKRAIASPRNGDAIEKIRKVIESPAVEIVSFDIFDTLLVRPVLEPTDLFSLLDDRSQVLGLSEQFTKVRIAAEKHAKAKLARHEPSKSEPTIDSIYESFSEIGDVTTEVALTLKAMELGGEKRWLSVRPRVRDIYDHALRSGKRVIAVSDTYHSCEFIASILREQGFGSVERIYVSSETGKTKAKGTLFPVVLKDLKVSGSHVLHIGDNYQSDIQNARDAGLLTAHVPSVVNRYFSNFAFACAWSWNASGLSPQARMILGHILNYCDEANEAAVGEQPSLFSGNPRIFGSVFLGPLLLTGRSEASPGDQEIASSWAETVASSNEEAFSEAAVIASGRFLEDAELLLNGRSLTEADMFFLSNTLARLLGSCHLSSEMQLLDSLPPLPEPTHFSKIRRMRSFELNVLRPFLRDREYVRLIIDRQTFLKQAKNPILRTYGRWKNVIG